jgi:hypothetical protein
VFITNLVITIVTNADPFCNSAYKWYVSQGEQHSPKHEDEISGINIYITIAYIFIKYALPYVLTYLFFY